MSEERLTFIGIDLWLSSENKVLPHGTLQSLLIPSGFGFNDESNDECERGDLEREGCLRPQMMRRASLDRVDVECVV